MTDKGDQGDEGDGAMTESAEHEEAELEGEDRTLRSQRS
jgi:hypothetical protein